MIMCTVMIVVVVIMLVAVKRKRPLGACAKQCAILWRISHHLWRSLTADMTVKAQHAIRSGHYDVQIMADH